VTQRYQCIAPDRYLINCLPGEIGAFGGEKTRVRVMAATFWTRTDFRSAADGRAQMAVRSILALTIR
jgi:hypothetical protein